MALHIPGILRALCLIAFWRAFFFFSILFLIETDSRKDTNEQYLYSLIDLLNFK